MQRQQADNISLQERLSYLHGLDKESFEQERKRIIQEELSKYPKAVRERLKKFQWTLDMKRKKCKNALEACFMFHDMLMEQVYGENGLLENLEKLVRASSNLRNEMNKEAKKQVESVKTCGTDKKVATKVLHFRPLVKEGSGNIKRHRL